MTRLEYFLRKLLASPTTVQPQRERLCCQAIVGYIFDLHEIANSPLAINHRKVRVWQRDMTY